MRASEPAHAVPREVHSNELVAQKRWFELVLGRGECTDEAGGAASAAGAAEACGNDRHPDLAGEPVVDRGAEDDLCLVRRGLADDLRRLVHLEQRQIVAAGDREQDPASGAELRVDQRRAKGAFGCLAGAILRPGREADTHQGRAGTLHDRPHVGEVEIDQTREGDQVADALDALPEDVVGDLERVEHRRRAVEHLEQAVVRDHDRRVALLAQGVDAGFGLRAALRPLELERRRDDADCERTEALRDLRDDRGGAGTGPAALAGSDEDHVRTSEGVLDLVVALLRRLAADPRVGAGAESLRQVAPDMDLRLPYEICSCCMSVLTATNSTWLMPASIIRLTAFRPAPPTPTTWIFAR